MGTYKTDTAIVIPALNPDNRMITLVKQLREHGFENIVLVDDGSEIENRKYFKMLLYTHFFLSFVYTAPYFPSC